MAATAGPIGSTDVTTRCTVPVHLHLFAVLALYRAAGRILAELLTAPEPQLVKQITFRWRRACPIETEWYG